MKYAILGAGAMGSIVGGLLARGGQDVLLVDPYKEHLDKIKTAGLKLTFVQKTETVRLDTCTNPAEAGPVDVVVLLVKGFHSEAAIKGAPGLFTPDTYVCSLQNGLGNEDCLTGLFPRERILQGVLRMTGSLTGPGEAVGNVGGGAAVYLGSLAQNAAADAVAETMARHLQAGGAAAEFTANVAGHIWAKVVINACVNGTCGILRLKVKDYFAHPEGLGLVRDIAREVVAVAAAKGIQLNYEEQMADMLSSVARAGDHYPSMAQDIRARRRTEIDSLNGAIARYGRELGIPTPANDSVARFVKIIEDNYANQF